MKLKELYERLGVDPKEDAAGIRVEINGLERHKDRIPPIGDFEVDTITVKLDLYNACQIKIYPDLIELDKLKGVPGAANEDSV